MNYKSFLNAMNINDKIEYGLSILENSKDYFIDDNFIKTIDSIGKNTINDYCIGTKNEDIIKILLYKIANERAENKKLNDY